MGEFRRSGGFGGKSKKGGFKKEGGRRNFGDRQSFGRGDRDGGRSEMFSATCAACHKSCEVPFRPNNDRPVYCSNCFQSNREGVPADNRRRDSSDRHGSEQYAHKNHAAAGQAQSEGRQILEVSRQIEAVNAKLNTIIQLMADGKIAPVKDKKEKGAPDEASLKAIVESVAPKAKESKKKTAKKKETKKSAKKVAKKVKAKKVAKKTVKRKTAKKKA